MATKITKDDIKNLDYQVKTNELVKEIIFLREFGTKTDTKELNDDSSEIQK